MELDQHQFDERRGVLTLRAFWIGLLLFGLSLWAVVAAPGAAHRQAFDGRAFDQVAKLAPAASQRQLAAKPAPAKPHRDATPGDHPAVALAELANGPAPAFSRVVPWTSTTFQVSRAAAHHYSATGPPGLQLS